MFIKSIIYRSDRPDASVRSQKAEIRDRARKMTDWSLSRVFEMKVEFRQTGAGERMMEAGTRKFKVRFGSRETTEFAIRQTVFGNEDLEQKFEYRLLDAGTRKSEVRGKKRGTKTLEF